ncbi:hypothetical protein [Jatrophihabitans fulvus]
MADKLLSRLVTGYVLIVVATLVALAVLSAVRPSLATDDAWVHAAIVTAFAVLLPLRLRSAAHGNAGALRAVAIIATVLVVVNVVEAAIPGTFPAWMRIEMVGIAVLMAAVALTAARTRRPVPAR